MNQQSHIIDMDPSEPFINEPHNQNCCFTSILSCIHCFIMCHLRFSIFFQRLSFFCHFRWQRIKSCCRSKNNLERIKDCSNQLKSINAQIPNHVCIIINEDFSNIEKLYKLIETVVECLGMFGVTEITFYQFHSIDISLERINKFIQKNEVLSKLKIKYLSNQTGSQCIMVDVCKTIADKLLSKNIDLDDIDQNLIDQKVTGNKENEFFWL